MRKPQDQSQLLALVQEVLDEVDDLRAVIEYDLEDEMSDALGVLDAVEQDLRQLRNKLTDGQWEPSGSDLPSMGPVAHVSRHSLPFRDLLQFVNDGQKKGFADAAD
ncbi:MAG: hypothetical protein DRQ37_01920 [Gammaproteobacteria bacterium]|nr:MAG: hypothetical protein DRQ37_01920 [Gammaproteobacteria bacterium]